MGLFDRLRGAKPAAKPADAAAKADNTFFLDADASSTMGDVNLMRRSNTIRHTFPGTADNPGTKEMVQEVSSTQAKLEKASDGLPGMGAKDESISLTGGVPKPVKKTFAKQMSEAELSQRLKGTAVSGVNVPGGPAAVKKEKEEAAASQPQITSQQPSKPGSTDAFKSMVRDLTS
ncbi:MAG: hypothetical protein VKK98_02445 [Cyanobacteriota bacterium]|nr:hypothetical protein [Cyanobacteriota bacterium]